MAELVSFHWMPNTTDTHGKRTSLEYTMYLVHWMKRVNCRGKETCYGQLPESTCPQEKWTGLLLKDDLRNYRSFEEQDLVATDLKKYEWRKIIKWLLRSERRRSFENIREQKMKNQKDKLWWGKYLIVRSFSPNAFW